MKKLAEKNYFWIVLVIAVSLLAIYPLFKSGFYPFHDEPQIANLYEMTRAVLGGQFPPRWAPDFSFNYGYPFFNFYYPLPFYLGTFFYLVFKASLVDSLKLVFALSLPLSGIAFFFLMRKFFGRWSAFAGAIIYMFTPYRAVDLYVRGAVGEMWSFVFMPLSWLCLVNVIQKRSVKNIIFAALSLAGLILAHNLTAIIFLPFLAVFCLVLLWGEKDRKHTLASIFMSVSFGLALSAFYWLPALAEKRFVQSGTPFSPFDHFPFLTQLVYSKWGYGASVWGKGDGMSFQIGLINLVLPLGGVAGFLLKRKKLPREKKKWFYLLVSFLGFSIFLMNIRSGFLWNLLPLAAYIQFPWRILLLVSLFTSLMVGFWEECLPKKWAKTVLLSLACLAVVFSWTYFKLEKQIKVNDDYYLTRFFADRASTGKRKAFSLAYLNYSEDYLPLTIWTQKRPTALPAAKAEISQGRVIFRETSPTSFEVYTMAEEPAEVLIHNYYFPGWKAWVDGKGTAIKVSEPHGDISIPVPAGNHLVIIKLTESPIRWFSDLVSLASLTFLLILILIKKNFPRLAL